ncbi:MAG: NADH-quinone oxidoreductase subunit C [Thermoplasmata archaeon]
MSELLDVLKKNELLRNIEELPYSGESKIIKAETDKENLEKVARYLKDNGVDNVFLLSTVDMGNELYNVYHFMNFKSNTIIELKVTMKSDDMVVKSLTSVWKGANWHERESYDMFGIKYEGHPKLERILQVKDSTIFPFRKEFKLNVEGNK